MTNTNPLIVVYSENHMEHINPLCRQNVGSFLMSEQVLSVAPTVLQTSNKIDNEAKMWGDKQKKKCTTKMKTAKTVPWTYLVRNSTM
jgi:hypothetical protein